MIWRSQNITRAGDVTWHHSSVSLRTNRDINTWIDVFLSHEKKNMQENSWPTKSKVLSRFIRDEGDPIYSNPMTRLSRSCLSIEGSDCFSRTMLRCSRELWGHDPCGIRHAHWWTCALRVIESRMWNGFSGVSRRCSCSTRSFEWVKARLSSGTCTCRATLSATCRCCCRNIRKAFLLKLYLKVAFLLDTRCEVNVNETSKR